MKNKVIIHVGYPKTGTSSIQKAMAQIDGLHILGKKYPFRKEGEYESELFRKFCYNIYATSSVGYQEFPINQTWEEIKNGVPENKSIWLSDEGFSNPLEGDNILCAQRLNSFFPSAQVLIVIRNQLDWIRSYYEMWPFDPYIITTGTKRLTLDKWVEASFQRVNHGCLPQLKYEPTIKAYIKLFGEENVHVLPYEEYVKEPQYLAQKLSQLLTINQAEILNHLMSGKENTAHERYVQNLYKSIFGNSGVNKILPGNLKKILYSFIGGHKPAPIYSEENINRLNHYFAQSNNRLMDLTGMDLFKHNYPGLQP